MKLLPRNGVIARVRFKLVEFENGELSLELTDLPYRAVGMLLGTDFHQFASSTTGECYFVHIPAVATDWDTQGESHAG